MKLRRALFDTNIVIDYAAGIPQARDLILSCAERAISTITWIEFLTGIPEPREAQAKLFLDQNFEILPIDTDICEIALRIRKENRMKLPDALIYGAARKLGVPLITRNTKDFGTGSADIIIPYML